MRPEEHPLIPSLPWRAGSTFTMVVTGLLSKGFLYGFCKTQVRGLDGFLELLEKRGNAQGRQRGLVTVSNHTSVLDDPLVWGLLPLKYLFSPDNLRWSLGSHDLCFNNKPLATFFTLGQVLPTHRLAHSPFGGLFQPVMTQCIRLLSRGPFLTPLPPNSNLTPSDPSIPASPPAHSLSAPEVTDPFSSNHLTYTTNSLDSFPAPSAYANRRNAWVHIFPEGKVHQKTDRTMRYFKWGVARLILESEPAPDLVPIWVEGFDQVMHEARVFPRFIPRVGKTIDVTFGEAVNVDERFGDLRERWKKLSEKAGTRRSGKEGFELGILPEELKYSPEAVALRKECSLRVREEVLKVRKTRGWPDEDPKWGAVETYIEEGGKKEGRMEDGSWVKGT